MREPFVESTCEHHEGDTMRVAAWLFDCLDRRLPPAGAHLTLYLCYHQDDRRYFASWSQLNDELTAMLMKVYEQELEFDGSGFGDLRFDISSASASDHHLSFQLRNEKKAEPTRVEFQWHEHDPRVMRGTLNLVRRWNVPFKPSTSIVASLSIAEGAQIAPHVDRRQPNAKSLKQVVYLPEGRTILLIGEMAGCDLFTSILPAQLTIIYDSKKEEWQWFVPDAQRLPHGRTSANMSLDYSNESTKTILSLRGERFNSARSLRDLCKNMPRHSIEIVGCVLPHPYPESYGRIPNDAPAALATAAHTALLLPGGDWIYYNENRGASFLLRRNASMPGQKLIDGAPITLGALPDMVLPLAGEWRENRGSLPSAFLGEVYLSQPLVTPLIAKPMAEEIPHALFVKYTDSMLGRAPVRLQSFDGRRYSLVFKETARHSVYVFSHEDSSGHRFDPRPNATVDIGFDAEFIIGATHYRLRRVSDASNYIPLTTSSFASTGGAA